MAVCQLFSHSMNWIRWSRTGRKIPGVSYKFVKHKFFFFFNLFLTSCVIYSLFILIFLHMYNRWYSQLELNYLPKAPPKLSEIYWIGLARYLSGVGYESSVVLASNVISSGFVREYDGQQGRLLSMRRSVCRTVRNLMGTGGIEGLGHGNLPPACWGLHQQWS